MWESLVATDKELFLFLNGLGTATWDGFWLFVTNKWSSIPLYAALLILCFYLLGWRKTAVLLVIVTLLITATDQLANFFKYGVGRLRPCHQADVFEHMRLVKTYCGGKFGYFSAHAASSMALAAFFSFVHGNRIKWLPALLYPWALLVGYSRIYIGVHFPGDVLTGMCVGLLFGWLFARLYPRLTQKVRL